MPSESDKPIEKRLRDYAEHRRDAAGGDAFALHPVTRNALQVEVEREFGRKSRKARTALGWFDLAPGLIWGGAALALLAILFLWQTSEKPETGKLAMAQKSTNVQTALAETAPVRSTSAETNPGSGPLKAMALGTSAATIAPAEDRQEYVFAARNFTAVSRAIRPANLAASPAPKTETLASNSGNVRPEAAAAPAPSLAVRARAPTMPLQQSFRVTIVNDLITILDADESRYTGRLEAVDQTDPGANAERSLTFNERYYLALHGGGPSRSPVATQFVLTGTNHTSQLPVQITGRMTTTTQAVTAAISSASSAVPAGGRVSGPGMILRIQGTATVDGRTNIPIDASTQPQ